MCYMTGQSLQSLRNTVVSGSFADVMSLPFHSRGSKKNPDSDSEDPWEWCGVELWDWIIPVLYSSDGWIMMSDHVVVGQ